MTDPNCVRCGFTEAEHGQSFELSANVETHETPCGHHGVVHSEPAPWAEVGCSCGWSASVPVATATDALSAHQRTHPCHRYERPAPRWLRRLTGS